MWLAALAQTLLVTLFTSQTVNPYEIPKIPGSFPAPESIQITGIEKGTLTVKPIERTWVEFKPVMTADGPRVRMTFNGEVTLEATRLQIKNGDRVTKLETLDGKSFISSTERIPATDKPAPKPKQPDR
jgi:hypothetical protein